MSPLSPDGYLRFPTVAADRVVFVSEDDLWSVPLAGGTARRLTADLLGISGPRLSPDGDRVAFTGDAQGQPDLYVMPATGGAAHRLTWLGTPGGRPGGAGGATKALAWAPDGRLVYAASHAQPFSSLAMAYALDVGNPGPAQPLAFGPVRDVSYGPGGGVVIGRNTGDPALWKRYRGGTAGSVWLDRQGTGDFVLLLRSADIDGNIASPMWLGDRIYFISDHEGIGNLYSCSLQGDGITRHTDHADYYARNASTDGQAIVYQAAAQLWHYEPATGHARRVEVHLGSPRTQRQPRFVPAADHLGGYQLGTSGDRLVLDTRGKLFTLAPFDGPVLQHGQKQGARYRLARFLGDGRRLVVVSDAAGYEAIEVHDAPGSRGVPGSAGNPGGPEAVPEGRSPEGRRLAVEGLGHPVELVPSPDGTFLAVTNHRHQLLVIPVSSGEARVLDESPFGPVTGPTWSPDGRWVAYSYHSSLQTAQIKVADAVEGTADPVTAPEFRDYCPSFDPSGKYLYFLSCRTFDPVYDNVFLDLNFPLAARPYLVTLSSELPSPFVSRPVPAGTAPAGTAPAGTAPAGTGPAPSAEGAQQAQGATAPVRLDLDGIAGRVLEVPVPEARYEAVFALDGDRALLLSRPQEGALQHDWTSRTPPANGLLECFSLADDHKETFAEEVVDAVLSPDRSRLAYRSGTGDNARMRVVSTAAKPEAAAPGDAPGRRSGVVDLGRVRPLIDPGAEWAQMVREAWRLQPLYFWTADLAGVDWDLVLERYLPLVELAATRSEVSDLIWEVQGELGTSHTYELGGEYRPPPPWAQAHLGADLTRDGAGNWVVTRVVPGSSWLAAEASPLASPGVGAGPGMVIHAVNGQEVDTATGPGPLLANLAGTTVELTVSGPRANANSSGAADDAGGRRRVVVPTLADERPLRYRDWVVSNRRRVHEATQGRVGYVHVPDMMPRGWAEFHRSYLAESERDALVVDVRFNGGGHISGLVLEKLARRVMAWAVPRYGAAQPYVDDAPRGPLVAITNEWAGSDGDIFTHGFKLLKLGPVVGTRTWGGVIGIDPFQPLVDGTLTTQPHIAFWFEDVGWAVENYGTDPHEEVVMRPQDYAAGRDPQLDRAIELVLQALDAHHPPAPDRDPRPRRTLPVLPGR